MNNYYFTITIKEDDELSKTLIYTSALEAINVYNRFTDYGLAKWTRSIVLREPNGTIHTKLFHTAFRLTPKAISLVK